MTGSKTPRSRKSSPANSPLRAPTHHATPRAVFGRRRPHDQRSQAPSTHAAGGPGDERHAAFQVRGLEALEQPSRVTVVTPSRYVSRGFLFGLEEWRENGWRWERFGEMTAIKNRDLWQRIDRAMQYHQVECRVWRFDMPDTPEPTPEAAPSPPPTPRCVPTPKHRSKPRSRQYPAKPSRHVAASWREVVRDLWHRCRSRLRGDSRLQAA